MAAPSILSGAFLKPTTPPPSIPCEFDASGPADVNLDVLGNPYGPGSPEPPLVPGVLPLVCELSSLQHSVMTYNALAASAIGDVQDMRIRKDFFSKLAAVEASLIPRLRHEVNTTPQTLYLK